MKNSENSGKGSKAVDANQSVVTTDPASKAVYMRVRNFASYKQILEPKKYTGIEVMADPFPYTPPVESEDDRGSRFIINFKAIPKHKLEEFKELVNEHKEVREGKDGEEDVWVDLRHLRGITMSHSIFVGEDGVIPELPAKGETVDLIVGEQSDDPEKLVVKGFKVKAGEVAEKLDIASLLV